MIKVTIRATERADGDRQWFVQSAYLAPERIDTTTCVDEPAKVNLPPEVRSVVRYDCKLRGYRLYYVDETAEEVARARRREMRGENSEGPDYDPLS